MKLQPDHRRQTNSLIIVLTMILACGIQVKLQAEPEPEDENGPAQRIPAANMVAADADDAAASASDDDVIVSDIGLDQMRLEDPSPGEMEPEPAPTVKKSGTFSEPEELQIKDDQIITINRSLRKMIEENERLRQKNMDLDEQLRETRGQRNIDLNRLNTISVERDAYKSQNDVMGGLTQKYVDDIEDLKRQLQEKEQQLAAQLAAVTAEAEAEEGEAAAAPTIGLGTIQVNKTGRKHEATESGQDILRMLDDVRQKSEKLKADEAKVHYNMGNMFFKQKDYRKARDEFQSALRLSPQDSFAHFNLAFVSGEYLNDYQAAMSHYKEYLELNPVADDAPLVREKIIEAELFLRAEIPSSLEKQVQREKGRVYKN